MKNILITRPKEQARELITILEGKNFSVFSEPLFLVEKMPVKKNFFLQKGDKISAAIITSANAAFALIDLDLPRDLKIFSVGKKTAKQLLDAGFNNIVFSPKKDAASLCDLIVKTQKDKSGLVLYFHGSVVSFNFERELKKHAFKVQNILAYKTREMKNFSADFLRFSHKNHCDEVLIFSQKSAEIFCELVKRHNLLEYFERAQILCLSQKILEPIKKFGFKKVKVFDENPILKKFYD